MADASSNPLFIEVKNSNEDIFYIAVSHIAYFYSRTPQNDIAIALKGASQDQYFYDSTRSIDDFTALFVTGAVAALS